MAKFTVTIPSTITKEALTPETRLTAYNPKTKKYRLAMFGYKTMTYIRIDAEANTSLDVYKIYRIEYKEDGNSFTRFEEVKLNVPRTLS